MQLEDEKYRGIYEKERRQEQILLISVRTLIDFFFGNLHSNRKTKMKKKATRVVHFFFEKVRKNSHFFFSC